MTIDRAIEILNPEHREHYDSIETVNEACRMGMEALEKTRWIPVGERLPEVEPRKKLLVACEESQRVTAAFRVKGWEAYSCDIQEPSGGHPEWHILGDCLPLLNGGCTFRTMDGVDHHIDGRWDMILAFPPCTKTSNAGARHLWKGGKLNIPRYYDGLCGKALFMAILAADCPKIAVENPMPSTVFNFPKPTQIIQPYYFGAPWQKKTLLWLKGLAPLEPTDMVEPLAECHSAGTWFMKGGKERQKNRAKLAFGIANAMAKQWG